MVRTLVSDPCLVFLGILVAMIAFLSLAVTGFEYIFAASRYVVPWTPLSPTQTPPLTVDEIPYYVNLDANTKSQIQAPLGVDYLLLSSDIILRPVISLLPAFFLAFISFPGSYGMYLIGMAFMLVIEVGKLIYRTVQWFTCQNYWFCYTPSGTIATNASTATASTEFIIVFACSAGIVFLWTLMSALTSWSYARFMEDRRREMRGERSEGYHFLGSSSSSSNTKLPAQDDDFALNDQ